MSWASSEWKVGLPSSAQVKISELETQLEKLQKDRQQRQLQVDRLEALVDGQKKKHEEDRLRVLSMEKEMVQLNTNMEENIKQLLKAQQEVLAKDRNLLNYQNQLDAQKRLYDQETGKVKRLEMELEQQRTAMRSCADPSELTALHKKITELENLRSKQEELIKQMENKEDKHLYGQAGDHNQLQETIVRLEKECEGLKAANSKLEIELWTKANSDSDCALNTCKTGGRLQSEASKIQLQLEDARNKINDLEKHSMHLESSRHNAEIAYTKLEQELKDFKLRNDQDVKDLKFRSDQELKDLRCQLEESESNYHQEKRAVEAVKIYLKDSETKSRLLEEEINELRLHVQNSSSSVHVNQELIVLRDRCMKQVEQIKQLQLEMQTERIDNRMDEKLDKIEKLQELLDRRETEIKHLTKAQKDQDNQLQLMQKKLHAGEELIHSMNLIVNEHKTKCVDEKLELEHCKDQLKENVQAVQMLEIEKRQLKKAIQIKESIIQSLMKGDADSSKGMLKNQVVELRLKCEEYESKMCDLNEEIKSMHRGKESYSSPKYPDAGLMDKIRDLENELKLKQLQLDECIQELNSFRELSYSPRSTTSEMPISLSRKFNEKEAKLAATLMNLEKVTNQLQIKEKELKLNKQRFESLEKDYNSVSIQFENMQKHKVQTPAEISQIEALKTDLHKKDKLIRHLQNEMTAMQSITMQIEDFQMSIKDRDEKIFQLETDLDSEQRLKEERNLAVLTQQNKIKTLQSELDERDATIADMRNAHDENEMSTQYLRTIQANLQTELQEKENQCSVLQLELNKVQNICQEVESGNRTLQCQVEELKNRLEKITMDKEESDNNVSCLQMELFNLKNELQTTYKSAEKSREKMEHKTNEIVALSIELEKKERHIISQQIQLDKLLRSHEEQDACIHSLMSRLTSLQTDIEEKEKSSGIFSLQPDFLSSKTGLNPKVLQAELWAMKSQLESKEKQLEKARLHLEERDGSIQFLRTLLVTLQNDLEEKEKSFKAVQLQLSTAEESVRKQDAINFDLQKQLKSSLKENEEKMTKITAAINEAELAHRDQDDKKTRIQNLRSQMHTMQTKLESTLKEKEEKKSTISALRSQIQSLQNKIQMAQKDREDKRACIQALQSELQVLQDEVDVSRKVNDKKEHKIQLINTQLGAIKLELEEREKIINTLHSEMASLRQDDQDKDSIIDKLTIQLQTAQSKFESSSMAVQSLQSEMQNLKTISIKDIKDFIPSSQHNKKNFESYVQMLVSEMESMQFTLQSTQSEWEEKEDAFHAIANHVHKLQAKLEEKKMMTSNLEHELSDMTDQTKECRLRCVLMETQLLQDELESKEAALMDATQQLRQSGEQRRRVEQEVSKLLAEMEEIQQGQEKTHSSITPDSISDDAKDGNEEQANFLQLKMQLVQANGRIEILMSDSEEMRNAMEILEFEKLELQESQETLTCENQNLNKKLKILELEVEELKNIGEHTASKGSKQACSMCNEYLKEIMALKDLKEANNIKLKEQAMELTRTNQELNTLTTNLDVQKASLLAITEERDKAVFELSLMERENGNQSSPTETLIFQLEMKAQKESLNARVEEIVSKFLLTVKEHCTLSNDQGLLNEEKLVIDTKNEKDDDENVLYYLIIQLQQILHEIIEFKRSAHSKVKELEGTVKSMPATVANLEADKLQLSQLLNDKMSQLEEVLKSLELLTEKTMALEKDKMDILKRTDEKIETLEKEKEEISLFLNNKDLVLNEYNLKIDAMTKTISSMAVDHKELCDSLNTKLKQTELDKAELERNFEEMKQTMDDLSEKYRIKCETKQELKEKVDILSNRCEEIQQEKTKLISIIDGDKAKLDVLEKKKVELKARLHVKTEKLDLLIKEKNEIKECLDHSKEYFESSLLDFEMVLSDIALLLQSEVFDDLDLVKLTENKLATENCILEKLKPSAENLERFYAILTRIKDSLNKVLAAHEESKAELLCTLMQKNQSLQIENEKNLELESCIAKLNEELMEFKDSLENERLELVEKHLVEIVEMKSQVESQKEIEDNNKVLLDTLSTKLTMLEEEKAHLLDNVTQNLKTLDHRKAQLSAMKQELKIMKKEKEQIIGLILVREETIKDLEQKLKKMINENKTKCETTYRLEQTIQDLEEKVKVTENEKNRLAEIIKTLTEKVADLEADRELGIERNKKINTLESKIAILITEMKENDKRLESFESQLRNVSNEQAASFENEKTQLLTKIDEVEERLKEGEYELQREKENHVLDNAKKSNCEVDLREKLEALSVTIQQQQLEKADLLLSTTERISELEEVSCMQNRELEDMKRLLDESVEVSENYRKRAEKLEVEIEVKESTEKQNYLAKINKLEEEKILLQQALTEKVELLEGERKVIFNQLQDLEKVKNKLLFEVREKDEKIGTFEETLNDNLAANQELEKVKSKLMLELKEKEEKILTFEESLTETLNLNQELEKLKNKLMLENREKEERISSLEEKLDSTMYANQEFEKFKGKIMLEIREKEEKISSLEEKLDSTMYANQEFEKFKGEIMLEIREKEEKISSLEEKLDSTMYANQEFEKFKDKIMLEIREKDEKISALQDQVANLFNSNQELEKTKAKLRWEVKEKDEKICKIEDERKDVNLDIEKLRNILRVKDEHIEVLEQRINKLNSSFDNLDKTKNKLMLELKEKEKQCDDMNSCMKEIGLQFHDLEETNKQCISAVHERDEQISFLKERVKNNELMIEDLKKAKGCLLGEMREKEMRNQDMIRKLEDGVKKFISINQELERDKSNYEKEFIKTMEELREKEDELRQAKDLNKELEKVKSDMLAEMLEKEEYLKDSWTTNQELEKVKKSYQLEINEKDKELGMTLKINQELEKTKFQLLKEIRDKQDHIHNCEEHLNDTIAINQDLEKVKIKYLSQIRERDDRIQELEKIKSFLELDKALLEKDKCSVENNMYNLEKDNLIFQEKFDDLLKVKNKYENELQSLEDQLDVANKISSEKDEIILTYEKRHHELVMANQSNCCVIETLKGAINKLEMERELKDKVLDEESRRSGDLQRTCENLSLVNQKLKNENSDMMIILEKMQMGLTKMKDDKDNVSLQLGTLSEKYAKCMKELEKLNEIAAVKSSRIETAQNENQRLRDQLQELEQNVVILTESKRNLMAEFMLQKEESNKLNEQITDLTLELERRLRHNDSEKGSLDELQAEVDVQSNQIGVTDDSYLVLMLFKEKLESQLATATRELSELRAQVSVLQGDSGATSISQESDSLSQQEAEVSQNLGSDLNESTSNADQ